MSFFSPSFDICDGLKLLKTDRDVIRFINEHKNAVEAEFYVEAKDVEATGIIVMWKRLL